MGVNFATNLAPPNPSLKWGGNIDDVFKRFYVLARLYNQLRLRDYTTNCAWATIQPIALGRLYNQLRLGVSVVTTSYHGAASRIIKAHCVRFLFKVVKNCGFNIAHYRQVMHTGLQVLA